MPRYAKHVFLLAFLSISDITFRSRCSLASALSAIRSSTSSLGMTGADYLSLGRKINIRVSSWNLSFLYAHSKFQNSNRSFAPRNSISKSTSAVTKAPRFSRSGAHLDFVRSWRKRPNTSSRSKRAQWRSTVRDQHAENLLPSKSVQCLSSLDSCNRLLLFLHVQIKDYAVKKKETYFQLPRKVDSCKETSGPMVPEPNATESCQVAAPKTSSGPSAEPATWHLPHPHGGCR